MYSNPNQIRPAKSERSLLTPQIHSSDRHTLYVR